MEQSIAMYVLKTYGLTLLMPLAIGFFILKSLDKVMIHWHDIKKLKLEKEFAIKKIRVEQDMKVEEENRKRELTRRSNLKRLVRNLHELIDDIINDIDECRLIAKKNTSQSTKIRQLKDHLGAATSCARANIQILGLELAGELDRGFNEIHKLIVVEWKTKQPTLLQNIHETNGNMSEDAYDISYEILKGFMAKVNNTLKA